MFIYRIGDKHVKKQRRRVAKGMVKVQPFEVKPVRLVPEPVPFQWKGNRKPEPVETYNFIVKKDSTLRKTTTHRPRPPPRSSSPQMKYTEILNNSDSIVNDVLEKWATQLGSQNMTLLEKREKLREALYRQCQSYFELHGQKDQAVLPMLFPNAICISMCFECLQQLLKIVPQHHSIVTIVFQGLLNAVYSNFNANVSFSENIPYSELTKHLHQSNDSLKSRQGKEASVFLQDFVEKEEAQDEVLQTLLQQLLQKCASSTVGIQLFQNLRSLPLIKSEEVSEDINMTPNGKESDVFLDRLVKDLNIEERTSMLRSLLLGLKDEEQSVAFTILNQSGAVDLMLDYVEKEELGLEDENEGLTRHGGGTGNLLNEMKKIPAPSTPRNLNRRRSSSFRRKGSTVVPPTSPPRKATNANVLFALLRFKKLAKKAGRGKMSFPLQSKVRDGSPQSNLRIQKSNETKKENELEKMQLMKSIAEVTEVSTTPLDPVAYCSAKIKAQPHLLGYLIKQSPDLFLMTIKKNKGILKYAMAQNVDTVSKFMHLSPFESASFKRIVDTRTGMQLLWENEDTREDVPSTKVDALTLKALMTSQVSDVASILVQDTTLSSKIFTAMTTKTFEEAVLRNFVFHVLDVNLFEEAKAFYVSQGFDNALSNHPGRISELVSAIVEQEENQDVLFSILNSCPHVLAALASACPSVLQEMVAKDVTSWRTFIHQMILTNSDILRDCLIAKVKEHEHGQDFIQMYDEISCENDEESENTISDHIHKVASREYQRRLYTRVVNLIVVNSTDLPDQNESSENESCAAVDELSETNTVDLDTDSDTDSDASTSPKLSYNEQENEQESITSSLETTDITTTTDNEDTTQDDYLSEQISKRLASLSQLSIPGIWLTFLPPSWQLEAAKVETCTFFPTERSFKTFIMDIFIERVKSTVLHKVNDQVNGDFTPFVCDFLSTKYEDRNVVGTVLMEIIVTTLKHIHDTRVTIFATACSILPSKNPSTVHHYLHSLSYMLVGALKVYRPGIKVIELADGSVAIPHSCVVEAIGTMFTSHFDTEEMQSVVSSISDMSRISQEAVGSLIKQRKLTRRLSSALTKIETESYIDFDASLTIIMNQWKLYEDKFKQRVQDIFELYSTDDEVINVDQFVSCIVEITREAVPPSEARMIFYDNGKEGIHVLDLHDICIKYQLQPSYQDGGPLLDSTELSQLRNSVGRSSVSAFENELKIVRADWKILKEKIAFQLQSRFQLDSKKSQLRKQTITVNDSIHVVEASDQNSSEDLLAAWDVLKKTILELQAELITNRQASALFVQVNFRRWIGRTKARNAIAEAKEMEENVILSSSLL